MFERRIIKYNVLEHDESPGCRNMEGIDCVSILLIMKIFRCRLSSYVIRRLQAVSVDATSVMGSFINNSVEQRQSEYR